MINEEMLKAYIRTYDSLDESELWNSWTERDFEKLILDTLNKSGCYAYKLPDKGTDLVLPDLLCHYTGEDGADKHTIYIEIKTPKGRLSKNQTISFSNLEPYCDVYIVKSIKDFSDLLKKKILADISRVNGGGHENSNTDTKVSS